MKVRVIPRGPIELLDSSTQSGTNGRELMPSSVNSLKKKKNLKICSQVV